MLTTNRTHLFKKYNVIGFFIAAILFIVSLFFVANNYALYEQTIALVTQVSSVPSKEVSGPNGKAERYRLQTVTAIVKNGEWKGREVTFQNEYSNSGTRTEKFKTRDRLFIQITPINNTYSVSILGIKRDTYVFFLIGLVILLLLFVSNIRGLFTLLSVLINVALFCVSLVFFNKSEFFSQVWVLLLSCFCLITIVVSSGFKKKTLGAILSTMITILLVLLLCKFLVFNNNEIPFETMSYLSGPDNLSDIFIISVMIGLLGAVMDVAITINSSVWEIIQTNSSICTRDLILSIKEIGYDIMGTMINVLFFAYMSSSLPIIVLKLHSGYDLNTIFRFGVIFDVIRFLVGSIGIVLAIPVSGLIAVLISKRGATHL
ncbi:MAG: YibE/F family protein [Lachnospiraceae bacterium]